MSTPPADGTDLAQRRFDNVLRLFDEFVRQHVRSPDATALRGLERRFAEQVLIQPSYWSQIKSRTRQIGDRLARQFEQRCRKPAGWMDLDHDGEGATLVQPAQGDPSEPPSSQPRDDDERFIVGLVLTYYRRHPKRARHKLLEMIGEVLTTPPPTSGSPGEGAAAEGRDGRDGPDRHAGEGDASAWAKAQRGVQPLKQRR